MNILIGTLAPVGILIAAFLGVAVILAICFRVVVSTNDVDIVQSRTKTVSYGKGQAAGNSYYAWPSWVPVVGIKVIRLPVSVFDVQLESYAAYDKGRVPFVIDIMAFFRIEDSNVAAQRVHSFPELVAQLKGILQGACRSILAKSDIEEILEERAKYGQEFTAATNKQLEQWGVVNVKNIELMDIRDTQTGKVISNIMAKKQSLVEMQSRVQVAQNMQTAQTAEIDAVREVNIRKQQAEEQVGIRTAQKEQQVGIAHQKAQQEIKEQEKITTEKEMFVQQVQNVRTAEIHREVQVVEADQERQTAVIKADGEKQKTITIAEGTLGQAKLHAEGVEVEGKARGAAEQAVLLAPVNAQITLAKEIGENPAYQTYLVSIRQIEAGQVVGIEQAKALTHADVKIISNAGTPVEGMKSVMDLLTPKGGQQIGAMLEAFKNTDVGAAVVSKLTNGHDHHEPPLG